MRPGIVTFLMFDGKAEEAMRFYTPIFEGSGIVTIERYEAGAVGV